MSGPRGGGCSPCGGGGGRKTPSGPKRSRGGSGFRGGRAPARIRSATRGGQNSRTPGIGRAAGWGRGENSGGAGSFKKKEGGRGLWGDRQVIQRGPAPSGGARATAHTGRSAVDTARADTTAPGPRTHETAPPSMVACAADPRERTTAAATLKPPPG